MRYVLGFMVTLDFSSMSEHALHTWFTIMMEVSCMSEYVLSTWVHGHVGRQ